MSKSNGDRTSLPTGLSAVLQLGENVHWTARRQDEGTFAPFVEARAYQDGIEVARFEIDDTSAREFVDTICGHLK